MLQPIDENAFVDSAPIFMRTPPGAPIKKRPRLDQPNPRAVTSYFLPATPTRPKAVKTEEALDLWTIRRRRTGIGAYRTRRPPQSDYCGTLEHDAGPFQPGSKPSTITLPSIHPPTGRVRDHAPVLAVATSHAARAGPGGHIAAAGEEGGVLIVPLDEAVDYPMQKGSWWRAHGNAIFDMSWSDDDTQLVSSSWARLT